MIRGMLLDFYGTLVAEALCPDLGAVPHVRDLSGVLPLLGSH